MAVRPVAIPNLVADSASLSNPSVGNPNNTALLADCIISKSETNPLVAFLKSFKLWLPKAPALICRSLKAFVRPCSCAPC